jgi:hypothetical protein
LTTLSAFVIVLAVSCNGDNGSDAGNGKWDGQKVDMYDCYPDRPPTIDDCEAPPNIYSETRYYCRCRGAICGGGSPTGACNGQTNDCRYFYDSCIPQSYTACTSAAPDYILGLCGYCFFAEAGMPDDCDKLADAGNGVKDSGPSKDAPAAQDAPAADAPAAQ